MLTDNTLYSFEKLEPRILLSADLLPIAIDPPVVEFIGNQDVLSGIAGKSPVTAATGAPHQDIIAQTSATQPGSAAAQFSNPSDPQPDLTEPPEPILSTDSVNKEGASFPAVSISGASTLSNEIIFINNDIESHDILIKGLEYQNNDQQVIILDATGNGLTQISSALAGYSSVDAIHFISHGADGTVKLGSTWLSADNIDSHAEEITSWGRALSPDGDILFYGCDLATHQKGQEVLTKISSLTSADVAASTNDTGHTMLGGTGFSNIRLAQSKQPPRSAPNCSRTGFISWPKRPSPIISTCSPTATAPVPCPGSGAGPKQERQPTRQQGVSISTPTACISLPQMNLTQLAVSAVLPT